MRKKMKKALSLFLSAVMIFSMFAGMNITSIAETSGNIGKQTVTNINIPESEFEKFDLPFEWDDVLAYTSDDDYAVFVTGIRKDGRPIECKSDWDSEDYYSTNWNDALFTVYSTNNFTDYIKNDFEVPDIISIADIPDEDLSEWYYYIKEHYIDIKVNKIDIETEADYYISCNLFACVDTHEDVYMGYILKNGIELQPLTTEVSGEILHKINDTYIMLNYWNRFNFESVAGTIPADEDDYYDIYYDCIASLDYYISKDLVNWEHAKSNGIHFKSYTNDPEEFYKIATLEGYTYNKIFIKTCLDRRFDGTGSEAIWSYGDLYCTQDLQNFFSLEKVNDSYDNDKYIAIDDDRTLVMSKPDWRNSTVQMLIYNGSQIEKILFTITYNRHYYYSLNNDLWSFAYDVFEWDVVGIEWKYGYTDIYTYNPDSDEVVTYKSAINYPEINSYGGYVFTISELVPSIYQNNKLLLDFVGDMSTLYIGDLPASFSSHIVFNDKLILIGDENYMISEEVLANAVGIEYEKPSEEPTTDPTEPSTDPSEPSSEPTEPGTTPSEPSTKPQETELLPKDGSDVVLLENHVAQIKAEQSVADILAQLENENVKIVDKNGKELAENAFIGTGAKVQILDKDGNALSEYTALVPMDVSGDGKISAADARSVLRASAQLDLLEGVYSMAANADGNDKITAADARKILRVSAKLEK